MNNNLQEYFFPWDFLIARTKRLTSRFNIILQEIMTTRYEMSKLEWGNASAREEAEDGKCLWLGVCSSFLPSGGGDGGVQFVF